MPNSFIKHVDVTFTISSVPLMCPKLYHNRDNSWTNILRSVGNVSYFVDGTQFIAGGVIRDNLVNRYQPFEYADIDVFVSTTEDLAAQLRGKQGETPSSVLEELEKELESSFRTFLPRIRCGMITKPRPSSKGGSDSSGMVKFAGGRILDTVKFRLELDDGYEAVINIILLDPKEPTSECSRYVETFNTEISKCWAKLNSSGSLVVDLTKNAKQDIARKEITYLMSDWTETSLSWDEFMRFHVSYLDKLIKKRHFKDFSFKIPRDLLQEVIL